MAVKTGALKDMAAEDMLVRTRYVVMRSAVRPGIEAGGTQKLTKAVRTIWGPIHLKSALVLAWDSF